jgi:hypothetical protein
MSKIRLIQILSIFVSGAILSVLLISFKVQNSYTFVRASVGKIVKIDAQYAADFSNDKVLVGASHDIFVGKVVQELGSKDLGDGPETQFSVAVIDNLKGNLQGTVTVDQQGGYKNGVLYVVGDDHVARGNEGTSYLLQPGSTYLFATRYNLQENWYTLNSYPTASKLITSDKSLGNDQLKSLAENDPRFKELQGAYPNEVLIDADVKHNNALNNYISLQQNPQTTEESTTTETAPQTQN